MRYEYETIEADALADGESVGERRSAAAVQGGGGERRQTLRDGLREDAGYSRGCSVRLSPPDERAGIAGRVAFVYQGLLQP